MRYVFPLGHTIIFLAWSLIDYKNAYIAAGEYENGLAGIRWGANWILKVCFKQCNTPRDLFLTDKCTQATKLDQGIVYAQVGDTTTGNNFGAFNKNNR